MLMVVSPAKTLDFESEWSLPGSTKPRLLKQSAQLIQQLRDLSPQDISALMKISDKLGLLNFDRFQAWDTPFTVKNARPAVQAFKGDVYTGLEAETFSPEDMDFAQAHLRILSGLYGLLRPKDLMQAYRLEMGTKFANSGGKDLYQFWGGQITDLLNKDLADNQVLINLASNEYFRAVQPRDLKVPVITPVFKDRKNGQYKIISFFAKKARGLMAAWVIRQRLDLPEALKDFDVDGYSYVASASDASTLVFHRDEQ